MQGGSCRWRLTEEEERDVVLVITTVSDHKSLKQQEIWTLNAPFLLHANVYKGNVHAAHDPFLESIQTSPPTRFPLFLGRLFGPDQSSLTSLK